MEVLGLFRFLLVDLTGLVVELGSDWSWMLMGAGGLDSRDAVSIRVPWRSWVDWRELRSDGIRFLLERRSGWKPN